MPTPLLNGNYTKTTDTTLREASYVKFEKVLLPPPDGGHLAAPF